MTVAELQDQIKKLDDTQFQQLLAWVVTPERERRQARPAIEQAQAEIVTELQDAGKLEKPKVATEEQAREDAARVPEWRDPGTDHSLMYHYGDVVRYQGKLVRSTHKSLNHWAPGTLNFDGRIWEDITPAEPEEDPTTGETITEWRPGIATTVGMKLTYKGSTYEVIQAHTTQAGWEPGTPGLDALYKPAN